MATFFLLLLAVLPSTISALSVWSYNIMDSGFASSSGVWDPVGNRIPGNLTDFLRTSAARHVDVLGIVETAAWTRNGSTDHPGYIDIAESWGFSHVHVRSNCAIMSKKNMSVLEEPEEGSSTIVASIDGVIYIVTSMSSESYASKYEDFKRLGELVNRYDDQGELILMGDLNAISPLDSPRYNQTLLCGNGTYNPNTHSGEYVINFCLPPEEENATKTSELNSENWMLDFKPMETLLTTTNLTDLCFVEGGFYDADPDRIGQFSSCAFSNPTLLIRMTGSHADAPSAYKHAQAKIDYILANKKMLESDRFVFHHSTVLRSFQADGCSDHYPIEATFL
eukprot:g2069.t1